MGSWKWLVLLVCFAVCGCASAPKKQAVSFRHQGRIASKCDGKKGAELIKCVFPNEAAWNQVFPIASKHPSCDGKKILSREHLISAAADSRFRGFLGNDSTIINLQELAAFLGNASQETTGADAGKYNGGLCFAVEVGCPPLFITTGKGCCAYCSETNTGPQCPCGYYGRGALQISWPSNYLKVSKDIFRDDRLYKNPNKLLEGDTAWKASIAFWMNHYGGFDKKSQTTIKSTSTCHNAITSSTVDFGKTVEIINGDIECNKVDVPKVLGRIGYYKELLAYFSSVCGVDIEPTPNLKCCTKSGPGDKSTRCGKTEDGWVGANKICGKLCTSNGDCPDGSTCYADLSEDACK